MAHRPPRRALAAALAAIALVASPALAEDRAPNAPDLAPVLLEPLASFGAARVDDWLYVYSGHTGPTHHHARAHLSPVFARLNLLDMTTWERLPCPQRLQSVQLVAHDGGVIRVGGMTAHNATVEEEADLHSVAAVERFDPVTRTWTALPDLPEPRSSHAACVIDEQLYVVGGWTLAGEDDTWLDTAWVLDLADADAAWEPLPEPMFDERRALAAAAGDGELVVMGGLTWAAEFTSEVYALDLEAGTWRRADDLPFRGFGVAAVGIDGDVYASGLKSALYRLGSYGADLGWEEVGSLMQPRYFHQLVPLDRERLLAVGGVTKPGGHGSNRHLRTCEVLDLESRPAPRITEWVVPNPGRAKNRQGVFLHHDSLYCFGGNDSLEQHDFGPEHFLDEAFRLDLGTLRTQPLPPLPVKRQSLHTLVLAGEAPLGFALGGFGHTGEGTRSWPDAFVLDLKEEAWEARPGVLPAGCTQFGLVEREGAVYAFGGLDYDSSRPKDGAFAFLLDVLVSRDGGFVPAGITLERPRRAFGGALLGDRYYMIGGMKEGFALVEEDEAWDFAAEEWVPVPAPSARRLSPEVVALNGKLYVAGGRSPDGEGGLAVNPSVEVFDPASATWSTRIERLPLPTVTHMRVFPWRDRLLVYSAHSEEGAIRLLVIEP